MKELQMILMFILGMFTTTGFFGLLLALGGRRSNGDIMSASDRFKMGLATFFLFLIPFTIFIINL